MQYKDIYAAAKRARTRTDNSRRKPVACALCKEETTDRDAICEHCRLSHALGEAYRQAQADEAGTRRTLITVPHSLYPGAPSEIEADLDVRPHSAARELMHAIINLADVEAPIAHVNMKGKRVGFTANDHDGYFETSRYLATEETADLLNRIFALVRMALAYEKDQGRKHGESFVTKLAAGQISLAEINKV